MVTKNVKSGYTSFFVTYFETASYLIAKKLLKSLLNTIIDVYNYNKDIFKTYKRRIVRETKKV